MSKVVFMDPIDHVSGKLSKKSRVGKRSTPYTAAELARFDKFSAVAKAVAAVMKNPASLQTAQAEFAAQTTFKKLRNYLWDREWANYQG